jgi:crotonobetainyl-CoA:carnitine CoA-transferase CaiB-like acyl-CoA transferase
MILGDLGANVIKVERPTAGDDTRGWGPPFDARGESAYYLSINRNKISVALELSRPGDRLVFESLLRGADVVVDNFRPGVLRRLGIDVDAWLEERTDLIWCTISGFEKDSNRPGYDFVVQAESGWMAITGAPEGEPMKSGIALADILAGKDAALRLLAALVARAGKPAASARRVHVSLATSARAALINVAQNAMVAATDPRRWGNAHANLVPYQLFHAADRAIVIAVGTDAQWRACAEVMGLTALAADSSLATNSGRLARREFVVDEITRVVAQRPAVRWMQRLTARDVPCGLVKTVPEVIAESPGASALSGMPSSVGGTVRLSPPRLDEHGPLVRQRGWDAFASL